MATAQEIEFAAEQIWRSVKPTESTGSSWARCPKPLIWRKAASAAIHGVDALRSRTATPSGARPQASATPPATPPKPKVTLLTTPKVVKPAGAVEREQESAAAADYAAANGASALSWGQQTAVARATWIRKQKHIDAVAAAIVGVAADAWGAMHPAARDTARQTAQRAIKADAMFGAP